MPASAQVIYGLLQLQQGVKQKQAAKTLVLSAGDLASLGPALRSDTSSTLCKACLSIGEAISSLEHQCYSWATVKLYYASFYCVKAWLFASDECHLYLDGKTPAYI